MAVLRPIEPQRAWAAIEARDADMDGRFVYGVRTTRVACRPSCSSRRPLRANVEIFPTLDAAIGAGYRPCARCGGRPARLLPAIERAIAFIERHVAERVTLAEVARAAGASPHHLQRMFVRAVGASPRQFQERRRLDRFKKSVRGGASVGEATYAAGFGSSRGLYEAARAGLGMTPAAYRSGGPGEDVRYAIVSCDFGRLLVAATARGVCAVALGDSDDALVAGLRADFPSATVRADHGDLASSTRSILAATTGAGVALPLDLRGTAFQLRVWRALQRIPRGETRSYTEIAAAIGSPTSVRAVARACAANRVALLVPCHRVVPKSGAVGGYRWGAARKGRLLAAERRPGALTMSGGRGEPRSRSAGPARR